MPLFLLSAVMVCFAKPYVRFLTGLRNKETDAQGEAKLGALLLIYVGALFILVVGILTVLGVSHEKPG
jgi:undecaprenyl pyrophosphate phosphatase UppP